MPRPGSRSKSVISPATSNAPNSTRTRCSGACQATSGNPTSAAPINARSSLLSLSRWPYSSTATSPTPAASAKAPGGPSQNAPPTSGTITSQLSHRWISSRRPDHHTAAPLTAKAPETHANVSVTTTSGSAPAGRSP